MTDGAMLTAAPRSGFSRVGSTIGWGLFCASSWTWCIGMFLPLILLQVFGWSAFWIFAIPNVIGCAAMGYVLDAQRSRRFVDAHARPIRIFSFATVLYQVFFIGYACSSFLYTEGSLAEDRWPVLGTVLTLAAAAYAISRRGDLFWRVFALLATIAAVALFWCTMTFTGGFPLVPVSEDAPSTLAAAPVFVLGFLLCPYLDPTFHRARQQVQSRHAFLVFGIVFAFMLAFAASTYNPATFGPVLFWAVLTQWLIQLVFTIGAHMREINQLPHAFIGANLMCLAAVVLGAVAGLPGIAREEIYLCLLGLYALPFPLYVVAAVAAGPLRKLPRGATVAVILVSLALAPFAWIGFVERTTPALLVVFFGVLLSGIVIGLFSRRSTASLEPAR